MKHLQTFLLVLIYWIISNLNAQINIQFNAVNTYLFSSKECLNFVALNSGQKPVEVKFLIKIDNNNNKVVDIESSNIVLIPGANVINANNLSIKNIQYYNSSLFEIEQKTGTFPSGSYTICAWSVCALPDCGGLGIGAGATEQVECLPIQVENPTPLLLSYPENNSEIDQTRPLYTWIPPGPVASSASLNYSMTLVEIQQGQNKSDALALNRPIIQENGLSQPMLNHPLDLPALEEGKTYAWQVQAFVGQTFFAKSEQWKFKVKKEEKKEVPKQAIFPRENSDPYVYRLNSDSLLIGISQTISSKSDSPVSLKFKTPQGQVLSEMTIQSIANNGYILYKISKGELEKISKSDFLIIEIIGIEGNNRFLKVQL